MEFNDSNRIDVLLRSILRNADLNMGFRSVQQGGDRIIFPVVHEHNPICLHQQWHHPKTIFRLQRNHRNWLVHNPLSLLTFVVVSQLPDRAHGSECVRSDQFGQLQLFRNQYSVHGSRHKKSSAHDHERNRDYQKGILSQDLKD